MRRAIGPLRVVPLPRGALGCALGLAVAAAGCKKATVSAQGTDAAAPSPACVAADKGRAEAHARFVEGHLRAALTALDAADAGCPGTASTGLVERVRIVAALARKEETAALVLRIEREGDAGAKAAAAEATARVAALATLPIERLIEEAVAPAEPALHAERIERARDVLERDQKAPPRLVVHGPTGPVKQVVWDRVGILLAHGPYVSAYDDTLHERARAVCGVTPVTSLVADETVVVAASATTVCLFERGTLRTKGTLPLRAPVRLVPGRGWLASATAANPKTVVLTALDTLVEVGRVEATHHFARAFDVRVDGQRLAIGGEVFDVGTRKLVHAVPLARLDPDGVAFVRFSRDGRALALAHQGPSPPSVSLYDLTQPFDPHADDADPQGLTWSTVVKRMSRDLAFSPNGAFLAVSGTLTVRLFTTKDGESYNAPGSLHEHLDATTSAAWSPSGEWLVASGEDAAVRAWNLKKGKSVYALQGPLPSEASAMADALAPRPGCGPGLGGRIAALRSAGHVVVGCAAETIAFQSKLGSLLQVVDKDDKPLWSKHVAAPVVDPGHRWLLATAYDEVTAHALETGKAVAGGHTGPVIAVSGDGRVVARRDEEGDAFPTLQGMLPRGPLRLVDLATKKVLALEADPNAEWRFSFTGDGDLVGLTLGGAVAESTLVRLSGTTGKALWKRTVPSAKALDVGGAGAEPVVAVSHVGALSLHAASTGALLRTVGPVPGPATWSPGGRHLVSRGPGQITVHDAATGALVVQQVHPAAAGVGWLTLDGAGRAAVAPADRGHLACAFGSRLVPASLCEELFVPTLATPAE